MKKEKKKDNKFATIGIIACIVLAAAAFYHIFIKDRGEPEAIEISGPVKNLDPDVVKSIDAYNDEVAKAQERYYFGERNTLFNQWLHAFRSRDYETEEDFRIL